MLRLCMWLNVGVMLLASTASLAQCPDLEFGSFDFAGPTYTARKSFEASKEPAVAELRAKRPDLYAAILDHPQLYDVHADLLQFSHWTRTAAGWEGRRTVKGGDIAIVLKKDVQDRLTVEFWPAKEGIAAVDVAMENYYGAYVAFYEALYKTRAKKSREFVVFPVTELAPFEDGLAYRLSMTVPADVTSMAFLRDINSFYNLAATASGTPLEIIDVSGSYMANRERSIFHFSQLHAAFGEFEVEMATYFGLKYSQNAERHPTATPRAYIRTFELSSAAFFQDLTSSGNAALKAAAIERSKNDPEAGRKWQFLRFMAKEIRREGFSSLRGNKQIAADPEFQKAQWHMQNYLDTFMKGELPDSTKGAPKEPPEYDDGAGSGEWGIRTPKTAVSLAFR